MLEENSIARGGEGISTLLQACWAVDPDCGNKISACFSRSFAAHFFVS